MAQFDLYEVRGGLALDCQSDRLTQLPTRFVVPFEPLNRALRIADWLNPVFEVRGMKLIMATQLAGTIPTRQLGSWVASFTLDRDRQAILRALDTLISQA